MNGKVKPFFLAFTALSIAGLILVTILNQRGERTNPVSFTEEEDVVARIDNVHYSNTRGGKTEWVIDAGSATRYKEGGLVVFDDVVVVFYAEDGTPYTLKAREGRFLEPTGRVEASGDVEITSEKGHTLRTGSVSYMSDTREIATEDRVFITSGGMDVEGTGLRVDLDEGKFFLLRDVRALVKGDVA